jgi:hypothetical protein
MLEGVPLGVENMDDEESSLFVADGLFTLGFRYWLRGRRRGRLSGVLAASCCACRQLAE